MIIGQMAISSALFSVSFLLLAFLSRNNRKIFLTFSILFGFSAWSLFEYAIFLSNSDLFYLLLYPAVPMLPFFFSSITLLLFLLYCLIKELKKKK
ncbi:MAG: hypothetical protein NZ942_01830, partial [Candidatus Aenigmarchaeota archaeon]|nr:hypothetical protein [Candidatus Aenigmarchaeota archaeon]